MKMRPVLAHAAAVSATAIAGGLLADPTSAWYRTLTKPRWQPPAKLFGPVWSGLYATIAYAGSTVWSKSNDAQRKQWARALAVNLVLNATWSASFFRSHKLVFAAAHAGVLEASTLDLIRRARTASAPAAAALMPYAAWGGFALALNVDIARSNRTVISRIANALPQ